MGLDLLCQRAVAGGATRLVCPSGGNAGFAAAFAGAAIGVNTTVVVPETTIAAFTQHIRDIGAEVIVHGGVWDQANQHALQICQEAGVICIPSFNYLDIWGGNANLIDEAVAPAKALNTDFEVLICAFGGGGLMFCVLQGMHRNGMQDVSLIAVETDGAVSLHAAV